MKKLFALILTVSLILACDDGDLTWDTIEFGNVDSLVVKKCFASNVLHRINGNEVMFLDIKDSLINEPSETDMVIKIDGQTSRIIYRLYDGAVSENTLCDLIRPAKPIVVNEWPAIGGEIRVRTIALNEKGDIEGSQFIKGYRHQIYLKGVTFEKPGLDVLQDSIRFGNYDVAVTPVSIKFIDKKLLLCENSKKIYKSNNIGSLSLESVDLNLIANEETPLDKPRTALLGTINNKLIYKTFESIPTPEYFCTIPIPSTPKISDLWVALDGNDLISGIIEVATIKSSTSGFTHTITIKDATLARGRNEIKLGKNFVFGELTTSTK